MLFGVAYSLGELHGVVTLNLALLTFLPFSVGLIVEGLKLRSGLAVEDAR
jgi:hypothetical protein